MPSIVARCGRSCTNAAAHAEVDVHLGDLEPAEARRHDDGFVAQLETERQVAAAGPAIEVLLADDGLEPERAGPQVRRDARRDAHALGPHDEAVDDEAGRGEGRDLDLHDVELAAEQASRGELDAGPDGPVEHALARHVDDRQQHVGDRDLVIVGPVIDHRCGGALVQRLDATAALQEACGELGQRRALATHEAHVTEAGLAGERGDQRGAARSSARTGTRRRSATCHR